MDCGIGILNERSVHSWLKSYLEPDKLRHEVRIGSFVADIAYIEDKRVVEIQTSNFSKLLKKIDYYTQVGYSVKVVYPVSVVNTIHWIEPGSEEEKQVRKRRVTGARYRIFKELYRLRNMLASDNLSFGLIEIETDDYRYLDGFGKNNKRRATKIDKIPYGVLNEHEFSIFGGYEWFIPLELYHLDVFTTQDITKYAKCNRDIAGLMALILYEIGVLYRVGKFGNSYLYKIKN